MADGLIRTGRTAVMGGKQIREVGDGVELDDAATVGQLEAAVGAVELLPGPQGQSAYEVAVGEGFVGDEAAWLASLVGPQGDGEDGLDGASAYEIAVANGFVGSESAWLASLQGEDGDTGPAGPGVAVGGTAGQVLSKVDGTDFNTVWIDPPSSAPPVFARRDQEKTGVHAFVGLEEPGGGWKVYRRTLANGLMEYATGGSGYAAAWTGRAGLTYV